MAFVVLDVHLAEVNVAEVRDHQDLLVAFRLRVLVLNFVDQGATHQPHLAGFADFRIRSELGIEIRISLRLVTHCTRGDEDFITIDDEPVDLATRGIYDGFVAAVVPRDETGGEVGLYDTLVQLNVVHLQTGNVDGDRGDIDAGRFLFAFEYGLCCVDSKERGVVGVGL